MLSNSHHKEEAAALVGRIAVDLPPLIKPWAMPVLGVLLAQARYSTSAASKEIIATLGDISQIAGEDVLPQIKPLMALIIDTLNDQPSAAKRGAVLRTLGQICSYSGYVMEPLEDYPSLLGILIGVLKNEPLAHTQTRREAIRVLGILGALDPDKQAVNLIPLCSVWLELNLFLQVIEEKSGEGIPKTLDALKDPMHPSNLGLDHPDYYTAVVSAALLEILSDPLLSDHYAAAVDVMVDIFRSSHRLQVVWLLKRVSLATGNLRYLTIYS